MTRYLSAFLNEGIPGIPKTISPKTHKLLDYLTTGAFLVAGSFMWASNRRAAAAAFLNGGFVLGSRFIPITKATDSGPSASKRTVSSMLFRLDSLPPLLTS